MIPEQNRVDRVRLDLGRAFRARLLADSTLVLLGHCALLGLVAVLIWNDEHGARLTWWAAAVLLTTIGRAAWMRRAASPVVPDDVVRAGARVTVTLQGLAWGVGAAAIIPVVPMPDMAIVLVVIAGIGAGSLATLGFDPPSFYLLIAALSVPLPFAILATSVDRLHLVATGIVVVFAGVLLGLYRITHTALAEHLRALAQVKTLRGLLPMCANCKKIRDDKGYWSEVERYVGEHTDATFTHGVCPDCQPILYPNVRLRTEEND